MAQGWTPSLGAETTSPQNSGGNDPKGAAFRGAKLPSASARAPVCPEDLRLVWNAGMVGRPREDR